MLPDPRRPKIQQQPYGSALLGLMAIGLTAFGAFGFSQAMFRQIKPESGRKQT
jgi:hypothetical protein